MRWTRTAPSQVAGCWRRSRGRHGIPTPHLRARPAPYPPRGPCRWSISSLNSHSRSIPGPPPLHPDGGRPDFPTHLPGDGGSRHRTGTTRDRHPSLFILFRLRLTGSARVLHGKAEVHDNGPKPAGSAARRRRYPTAEVAGPAASIHPFPTSTLFTFHDSR